jgi:ABC-type multidrug transport system ATPase subunit
MPAIGVRDLRKSYGTIEAVRGVDFDVAEGEGEIFGFLGPQDPLLAVRLFRWDSVKQ